MKTRNYGVDLLRLILMYMVCVLHVLGQGGVLGSSRYGTAGFRVFWILEIICYCAVDGFALISGYVATNKPQKYHKLIDMWFQVFFYSFILTVILTVVGLNDTWGIPDMIRCAFPVTSTQYWYFTAYFGLFFAMPILDKFISSIDEKTAKKAFIILFILFSCMEIINSPFRTIGGFSMIWLFILYLMGALMKKINLFDNQKSATLIMLWIICISVTYGLYEFAGIGSLINYVSPTILLTGIIMVIVFSRLNPNPKIIQILSPLAFGIYLLHLNMVLWAYLYRAFEFIAKMNVLLGLIYALLAALLIFIAGLIVEYIRVKVSDILKVSLLSQYIVSFSDTLLTKACFLLK